MAKTRKGVILGCLLSLALPLSLFCGNTRSDREPEVESQTGATPGYSQDGSASGPEASQIGEDLRSVNLLISGEGDIELDGMPADIDSLEPELERLSADWPDGIVVDVHCDPVVAMGLIYTVQQAMQQAGLSRVRYHTDAGRGLPLILPPGSNVELLKRIPEEHIITILIEPSGRMLLDGRYADASKARQQIEKGLSVNDRLVVSIESHRDCKYRDFVATLAMAKSAGALRISVGEPRGQ